MPSHKRVYISAESDSSTTISGPPSVLALFKSSSEILSNVSQVSLRIAAAFHALHLSKPDVERIIGTSPLLVGKALKKNARIISTGSGTPFAADTLSALLPLVVDDILQNPLYWTKNSPSTHHQPWQGSRCHPHSFRPNKRHKIPKAHARIVGD